MHALLPGSRTLFVGDVHGCADELRTLLDQVHFGSGDTLVLVGDLIARGPDSLGVLQIARETGALFVRGNHEERLLNILDGSFKAKPGSPHAVLAERLSVTDRTLLEHAPLTLAFAEHNVLVVHAGLRPELPLHAQSSEDLLTLRTLRTNVQTSTHSEQETLALWGEYYRGPDHVIFGHHAVAGLQLHPFATGLDTGCVYGGRLTALILDTGQEVPKSSEARSRHLVHVAAKRVYFHPKKGASL
jgi:hypothetical protein